jgi:hypothetical protein
MKLNFKGCLFLILALCVLMLSACNKSTEEANQNNDGNSVPGNRQGGFMGDNPDVYGEVKAISGGQVTLAVLEMPQMRQLTDEERQNMRERRGRSTQNPEWKGNAPSANPDGNNGRRQLGGGFMGEEKKYSGENVTLTISSETPITTFGMGNWGNRGNRGNPPDGDSGNNPGNPPDGNNGDNPGKPGNPPRGNPGGFEEKKLALSDIKVGSLLQVWYKKDSGDNKEIEKIRVIQVPSNQSQNVQQNKN